MKTVSIIATGTEITSGQIINSNAAWIAQRLTEFNFQVQKHVAISDDKNLILDTLKSIAADSDLVIVTGGLGPTTDDLTRKIVAEWLNQPLELNSDEWHRILERLQRLEVTPREGHKWQAYFPANSEIFVNNAGTASGFSIQYATSGKTTTLWFLPGPPYEIQRIWKDHLESKLILLGPQRQSQLHSWCFLDLPESEVAHFVETTFDDPIFAIGYRASPPIVELKIWAPSDYDISMDERFSKLEKTFENQLHFKNHGDPTRLFLKKFKHILDSDHLYIKDEVTEGDLLFRLKSIKEDEQLKTPFILYTNNNFSEPKFPYLHIQAKSGSEYEFTLRTENSIYQDGFSITKKVSKIRENNWVCEKIFKSLCTHFKMV